MFNLKKWIEANRPKKHRTIVVFILMLALVATATNNSPQNDEQNILPKKTKLNSELNLEVYRNNTLLFVEKLEPGVEVDLIGKTQNGYFLANYKGESFQIHESLTTGADTPNDKIANCSSNELVKGPVKEWVISGKSYRNPRIVRTFPKSVMVRHDDGVDFVERDQIPKNKNVLDKDITNPPTQRGDKEISRSECNGSTTWLKLEKFMDLTTGSVSKPSNLWQVEEKILSQGNQNKDLGNIFKYDYIGLAELIREVSQQKTDPQLVTSIEDEFRKRGIKGRQQETHGCGVAALSTTLEFLLKEESPDMEVPWSKTKSLVLKYPDARGRIGFAYSMGPEILSSLGIATNQGTHKRKIRVRGLYKFFILNRDEAPNEKLGNNPLSFQTQAVEKLIINELLNKRPVLAATTSGPEDNKKDSLGPEFGKNELPHAVIIVGYEKLSDGTSPYRLRILNSWGSNWGQDGYGWLYPSKITRLYSIEIL